MLLNHLFESHKQCLLKYLSVNSILSWYILTVFKNSNRQVEEELLFTFENFHRSGESPKRYFEKLALIG